MQRFHRFLVLTLVPAVALFAEGSGFDNSAPPAPGTPVAPTTPGGPTPDAGGAFGGNMILLVFFGLMVLMLWSSIRKQKREAREKERMISAVKMGDKVVSIGGIRGEVVRKGEDEVDLRTGGGTVITLSLAAVNTVIGSDKVQPAS